MKYLAVGVPMLFGVEVLSWICLFLLCVFALYDLCIAIDREK